MYSSATCEEAIISVAFALSDGVNCISGKLASLGTHASVYVGIRNNITSGQALLALLRCGVNLYVIDSGSPSVLFHPKLYFAKSSEAAQSLIGSANLTFSGLNNNIEASTRLVLSAENMDDHQYITDIENIFSALHTRFPEHVLPVRSARDVVSLMRQGRLTDERARVVSSQKADSQLRSKNMLKRIPIPFFHKRAQKPRKRARTIIYSQTRGISGDYRLVWTSNRLTERDLNIPTGSNTNPTGSMLFKKGKTEDIDQRHYFFDHVFDGLKWIADVSHPHLLRSSAQFCIIINGSDYGVYTLNLTHNSKTNSAAYKQKNSMTQIHWGKAKKLIAKRDLLRATLKLYKSNQASSRFVMEFSD